ncbi:MAG: hypothetical protein A2138_11020 [Deltaproteobacteria bacterium RBG_16_71_12]|nr:MAG: hypothetical protein A2138_11020 [Deltaproteobacteria bacterium RBG_16_71_12]
MAFLNDRWPPAPNLAGAAALVVSLSFAAQAAAGAAALVLGVRELCAFLLAAGTSLLMRAYDELKDVDTDRRLAASGDESFRSRPIATGAIQQGDLVLVKNLALGVFVVGALGVAAAASFPGWTALGCAAVFGAVWLSSRWFFWPRIQGDLLLAFLTHNPIAGLVGAALIAALSRGAVEPLVLAALIASSWFPISAWEVSRKLRAPADETAYETYSKRLGVRGAAALLFGSVTASLAALVVLGLATHVSDIYLAIASAAAGLVMVGALRYAWRPSTRSARLRPYAELFALVATAGLPVALGIAHGVRLEALG